MDQENRSFYEWDYPLRDLGESWLPRPDQLGVIYDHDNPWALFFAGWSSCGELSADGAKLPWTPWQLQLNVVAQGKWHKKWDGKGWWMMNITNRKCCYCHTCKKAFHYLGIAGHRAAHRAKKEDCMITFTHGNTTTFLFGNPHTTRGE